MPFHFLRVQTAGMLEVLRDLQRVPPVLPKGACMPGKEFQPEQTKHVLVLLLNLCLVFNKFTCIITACVSFEAKHLKLQDHDITCFAI